MSDRAAFICRSADGTPFSLGCLRSDNPRYRLHIVLICRALSLMSDERLAALFEQWGERLIAKQAEPRFRAGL